MNFLQTIEGREDRSVKVEEAETNRPMKDVRWLLELAVPFGHSLQMHNGG